MSFCIDQSKATLSSTPAIGKDLDLYTHGHIAITNESEVSPIIWLMCSILVIINIFRFIIYCGIERLTLRPLGYCGD